MANEKKVRHILSLSGGKDSTALAIMMKDRVPEMEYVFCDTKKELPETYEYLDKLEAFLGRKIVRIADERGFDHWLVIKSGEEHDTRPFLPSSRIRWCTEYLKIKPFERYVGDDPIMLYVGIRADENRTPYVSRKPNVKTVLPFIEEDIDLDGVHRILEESGVGLPTCSSLRKSTRRSPRRGATPGRSARAWKTCPSPSASPRSRRTWRRPSRRRSHAGGSPCRSTKS
jgi:Phosphoadenosine phosphosulfate reductase family